MLGILLAVALIVFGFTKRASGTPLQIESEATPHPSDVPVEEILSTEESEPPLPTGEEDTPSPSPSPSEPPSEAVFSGEVHEPKSAPKKLARANTVRQVDSTNCVQELKNSGDLPNKPVTKDGFARTIPTKPVELKPGMERVVKTKEGPVGHVLKIWVNEEGKAISVQEGGHPTGEGRVVDPSVIVGEVDKDKL